VKRFIKQHYDQWLDRRIPAARGITLDQRRIFIFPSRQGLFFAVAVLAVLIAAINYENNLAFALAFLLSSLFVVAILHTYYNLSGLTIQAGRTKAAFAGEDAEFNLTLVRHGKREHFGIHLSWPKSEEIVEDICHYQERKTKLFLKTRQRGRMRAGRLLIESYYPLGLLRAWSWVDLDMSCLVYPKPVKAGVLPRALSRNSEGSMQEQHGAEDFYGFRDYAAGDSPKHVFWKSYAKGLPLQTKQYAAHVDSKIWLDWQYFEGMDQEARLSRLCYWALELSKGQSEYGLRLPGVEIAPARGEAHLELILRNLALFGIEAVEARQRGEQS
jgi:uncharacterized protein (DUF58 family)